MSGLTESLKCHPRKLVVWICKKNQHVLEIKINKTIFSLRLVKACFKRNSVASNAIQPIDNEIANLVIYRLNSIRHN